MKRLVIIGLLLGQFAFAQRQEIEFGKISEEEIAMTSYEKDTEAKAVVLHDSGKSIFIDTESGYDIQFTRHKRIKIFDKSEAQYAEVSIPYYVDGFGKTEKIVSIEAVTYNIVDGQLTQRKLNPASIYNERINERWYNQKFVFPDVQDGAILEYRYVLETPFHFNLPDWTFQDKIPTIYSEYEVRMIPFYEYVFLVQGASRFDYQNSVIDKKKRTWGSVSKIYEQNVGSGIEFQDYIHTYVMKNLPAFKDESYISSVNDYIIKMDFQLAKFHSPRGGSSDIMSTWPELNKTLLKHEQFGKYIKGSSSIAKKILSENLDLSNKDARTKAKLIIEYVKNSFEWSGYYGKYTSQSPKEFFNTKRGNVAEINLFMIALLNEAGINTKPIILSTRNHGKIPNDYPFDHFTNYVIAMVSTDAPFLADATENLLSYNNLPIRCNNGNGLVVENADTPTWISLDNNVPSLVKTIIYMELDTESLDVLSRVSIQTTENESFAARKKFLNDSLKIKEFYTPKIGAITKSKMLGYDRIEQPYSMNFETRYETEKIGENVVIKPFFDLPIAKNDLTQTKRTYPVDFVYPWENQFETSLEIPSNYTVTLPNGFGVDNELAQISLSYTLENNMVRIKGNYKFKKSIYGPNEYGQLKFFLDQIVKEFNRPIVLEKGQ